MSNLQPLHVQIVTQDSIEAAFSVLTATADWLISKGRRQRIGNTRYETYLKWQESGANYAVYRVNDLAGVFSLPLEPFKDWQDFQQLGSVVWLRALATHPEFRNQKIGEFAVNAALQLAQRRTVYLDCVSDFLPDYYSNLGFEPIARQKKEFDEGTFDITLMKSK